MARKIPGMMMVCMAFAGLAVPAHADVKDGVDAWSRGDFAEAVSEWQGPAAQGDADALFNLGQAYRLGRGVERDAVRAESYYARAAAKGHLRAADIYGLILFQDEGRREQALPYVQDAARRGDPRSQYLLGIALFNGELVSRDWVQAYALLTLANSQGLPQAAGALTQMDEAIPLAQRQAAQSLAAQMQADAQSARARELAAADLAVDSVGERASPSGRVGATPQVSSARVPQPIERAKVDPSVAAARAAVAQARAATGVESPSLAGADYARPAGAAMAPAQAPVVVQTLPQQPAASRPAPTQAAAAPRPAPATAGSGPWKVQLGAFSVRSNAEGLWSKLSSRPELQGRERLLVPTGRVTRLLAGGYPSKSAAQTACASLKRGGQDCLVTSK